MANRILYNNSGTRQKRKSVDCCWTPINDFDATEYKEMKKDIDKITDSLIKILKK